MKPLDFILVGDGSLLVQCAQLAHERGHRLSAVVSAAPEVTTWAEHQAIPVHAPGPDLAARLQGLSCDWLMSIANLRVLPAEVLALPRAGAVNFHDGPLPRRAGLNAPVWALLEGDRQHAICWHLMTEGVDAGDILEQREVDISDRDTALSLNVKCYGAALDSFPALLGQLESGTLRRQPQDAAARQRCHARDDRPQGGARLDFSRPADEVLNLVRGLDHGDYANPLACPRIEVAEGQVLTVARAEGPLRGEGAAGEVLEVGDDGIVVMCAESPVRLSGLRAISGAPAGALPAKGDKLAIPSAADFGSLDAALRPAVLREGHWRARLRAMDLPRLALVRDGAACTADETKTIPLKAKAQTAGRIAMALARLAGMDRLDIALAVDDSAAPGYLGQWVPLRFDARDRSPAQAVAEFDAAAARPGAGFVLDLLQRDPGISGEVPQLGLGLIGGAVPGAALTVDLSGDGMTVHVDPARIGEPAAQLLIARLEALLDDAVLGDSFDPDPLLPASERALLLETWNATARDFDETPVHDQIAAIARNTPDKTAVVYEAHSLSAAALDARANRIAHLLREHGIKADRCVGLHLPRGTEMVAAALGVLRAGGAFLPLDPGFPPARLQHYITDSAAPVILSLSSLAGDLPDSAAHVILLDDCPELAEMPTDAPELAVSPEDLAYLIYTSGSTGTPKGVMVSHRNLSHFLAAMDAHIDRQGDCAWLAVTSLSFDISVLEIFYSLARGIVVVLADTDMGNLSAAGQANGAPGAGMEFSLYYWGNDDGVGPRKYDLLLKGAQFADSHGFCAVWTPERHFHAFGGPYPNPSVTGAAVAAVTRNLAVRAGSCVAPLHHPARIAEEWAVIDNLTNGRVGLAMASGWQPDDFVLRPENTPPDNKQALLDSIDTLRRLWAGETVEFPRRDGKMHGVVTQPRPVSTNLPIWVTTAGNPATWIEAGKIGAHVLTHLLGQSVDEVRDKIGIYHAALREAGHDPADFKVTVMLHSYLAEDREIARAVAREPMKDYLRSAAGLIKQYAWAFPAFKKPQGVSNPFELDLGGLSPEEMDAILDFAFERYFEESGLFGTVADAMAQVARLRAIGVTEIACLIDFGIAPDVVLDSLHPLAEVVAQCREAAEPAAGDYSVAAQIRRHGVTHLQCTPSMARIIAADPQAAFSLRGLRQFLVGGEALPASLVRQLRALTGARIDNMYGPTETTIWSTTGPADDADPICGIGRPIANTVLRVLGPDGALLPVGEAGELCIGGAGVTRGYWQRPDLTAERFIDDPFEPGARLYRTGDSVRWSAEGTIDFLGRMDGQVKLRGYRIETGEIEARLEAIDGVEQAVVTLRDAEDGDRRLVAHVTGVDAPDEATIRAHLARDLPDYMLPARVIRLEKMPLTPNGKLDRSALSAPVAVAPPHDPVAAAPAVRMAAPAPGAGIDPAALAAIWRQVLGVAEVAPGDNFFDLGGHSLLAVQMHRLVRDTFGVERLGITDVFRFPVLSALAQRIAELGGETVADAPEQATASAARARADSRSDAIARRREMRAARGRKAS